jgi:hypothetical protein
MTTVMQQAAWAVGGIPSKVPDLPGVRGMKQLLDVGLRGWTPEGKDLLVKNIQYQWLFQALGFGITAGIATKLMAGYYPWEREDKNNWLKIGTGMRDASGNEILVTPPMFKDIRDIWEAIPGGGGGPLPWLRAKADPTLRMAVEIFSNTQVMAGGGVRPLIEPGTPPMSAAMQVLMKELIPKTPLAMVTPLRKYGELYPKTLGEEVAGFTGFRTTRGIGGIGEEANKAYRIKLAEQQQKLWYDKLTRDMERAYVEGDQESVRRMLRERAKNPAGFKIALKNFMLKHQMLGQYWAGRQKRLRPQFAAMVSEE